ncbi:esterase FE4 [Nomia melanderi]|uniref:esterase FE4 n=1 Tax=Nomia melanderi TaxID=2448451 RepID=UPI003FCCF3A4
MTRFRCTLLVCLFLVTVHCLWVRGSLVRTRFGRIRGLWSRSTRGRLAAHYLGIPYAQPPVGELRFRSPQPWNHTWNSTFYAIKDGPMCTQLNDQEIKGSEDCLYLNIFVPIISDKQGVPNTIKLPVMVYVYGGKYLFGSSNSTELSPEYLMDQNVILVTVNYRVNIMGFFSMENKIAPGNYGLKDVVMALRWVQENIDVFQGDPKSVTLWGESAGASVTHVLAYSRKTEGLFHRCIIQSGCFFNTWSLNRKGWMRQTSIETARLLKCLPCNNNVTSTMKYLPKSNETNEPEYSEVIHDELSEKEEHKILRCMRTKSAEDIVKILPHFDIWRTNPCCPFGPVIEEESEDAIITSDPYTLVRKRLFRDIPMILGITRDEGLGKTMDFVNELGELINNLDEYLPLTLEYHQILRNRSAFNKAVEEFYWQSNDTEAVWKGITNATGDAAIVYPMYQTLTYQSAVMNSSLYFYYFDYEGTFTSTFGWGTPIRYGVAHGDDLNYLMPLWNKEFSNFMLHNNESDITMINIMTEMWASFATTGVPRAWRVTPWPDYRDAHQFLQIGVGKEPDIVVTSDFLSERMRFWDEVIANFTVLAPYLLDSEELPAVVEEQRNSGTLRNPNTAIILLLILLPLVFRK